MSTRRDEVVGANGRFAESAGLDDTTLAAFDAAMRPYELPAELRSDLMNTGLSEAMNSLVLSLETLSIEKLTRKYNVWQKFTGIDLVDRIEFDLAAHGISQQIEQTYAAAGRAERILDALKQEMPKVLVVQSDHEALLREGHTLLDNVDAGNPLVERFQRKVANLDAMCVANRLSLAQIEIAVNVLTGLLDRFSEIRKLLLPAWQQHALAIAQSESGSEIEGTLFKQFGEAHARLAKKMV